MIYLNSCKFILVFTLLYIESIVMLTILRISIENEYIET